MARVLAAALPLLSCAGPAAGEKARRAEVAAQVDAAVRRYQRDSYAPGVSVSVIRAGRDTLVYRGYGTADLESDAPATPLTVYHIGSITKQFTAAAVLRLAEQGRLALDDSIGRHLPTLPPAWRGARIRHLLNHTAGIPSTFSGGQDWSLPGGELPPDPVIALVRDQPPDFAPGTGHRYSNVGYVVLGMLIEKVSGERYARYLDSAVLRPLGLAATRYCDVEPVIPHRAEGYVAHDTVVVNAPYTSMRVAYAAGALCSTAGDLAAWNHALATGRVVSPASWSAMTRPEGAARRARYGYGLFLEDIQGHRVVAHGGAIDGFHAMNAYVPADSLSVSILTNLGRADSRDFFQQVLRAALASSPAPDSTRGAAR